MIEENALSTSNSCLFQSEIFRISQLCQVIPILKLRCLYLAWKSPLQLKAASHKQNITDKPKDNIFKSTNSKYIEIQVRRKKQDEQNKLRIHVLQSRLDVILEEGLYRNVLKCTCLLQRLTSDMSTTSQPTQAYSRKLVSLNMPSHVVSRNLSRLSKNRISELLSLNPVAVPFHQLILALLKIPANNTFQWYIHTFNGLVSFFSCIYSELLFFEFIIFILFNGITTL